MTTILLLAPIQAFFLSSLLLAKPQKSFADKVLMAWLVGIGFHTLMTTHRSSPDGTTNARTIFVCCIATVAIAFGIRQGFGLFMRPITLDMGWTREALAATFATQALVIGLMAPLTGMLADRWSPGKVIMLGGALFSAGIGVMGYAQTPVQMWAGGGLFAGSGLSAVGLPLVLSVIGRIAPDNKRGLWLGIATSTATIGQIVLIPVSQQLIEFYGWRMAVLVLTGLAALLIEHPLPERFGVVGLSP